MLWLCPSLSGHLPSCNVTGFVYFLLTLWASAPQHALYCGGVSVWSSLISFKMDAMSTLQGMVQGHWVQKPPTQPPCPLPTNFLHMSLMAAATGANELFSQTSTLPVRGLGSTGAPPQARMLCACSVSRGVTSSRLHPDHRLHAIVCSAQSTTEVKTMGLSRFPKDLL